MYLAELHGKLPSKIERMEDILTSSVFSFFRYANRELFLKGYLDRLRFSISAQKASEAEFWFWPRFEENTEPDLVIIAGNYYLVFEAKYFSGFGEGTIKTKPQLIREIEGGIREAKNSDKEFRLIVITRDHYYKESTFKDIRSKYSSIFKWTNWQDVSRFLCDILEHNESVTKEGRDFALDLYNLLDRKHLRDFHGLDRIYDPRIPLKPYTSLFFEARTAKFRGSFVGFIPSLSLDQKLRAAKRPVFLSSKRELFGSLRQLDKLQDTETDIFYKGN